LVIILLDERRVGGRPLQKTWAPLIAGILSILAGAVGILGIAIIAVLTNVMVGAWNVGVNEVVFPVYLVEIWVIFIILGLIDVVAIIGGAMAIKRKVWGLALAGAGCSIFSIWGWLLGIAAIVLLIHSKEEFNLPAETESVKLEDAG
jgi:hypothetical protein